MGIHYYLKFFTVQFISDPKQTRHNLFIMDSARHLIILLGASKALESNFKPIFKYTSKLLSTIFITIV
jgi:hypothetical protein